MHSPTLVLSGIVCLNIALLTRIPVPSRGAFGVLLTAIGISWLADLIFLLDSVEGFIMRSPIHWSNLLNSVALIGYLVAAGKIETDKPARQDDAHSPASGPLPIITIVMVSAWLLIYITYGRPIPEMLPGLLWSLLVLFAFLCFREIWMIRENARWMASTVKRESSARAEALMLEYLKAVFNSTPDMIWSVDPEPVLGERGGREEVVAGGLGIDLMMVTAGLLAVGWVGGVRTCSQLADRDGTNDRDSR